MLVAYLFHQSCGISPSCRLDEKLEHLDFMITRTIINISISLIAILIVLRLSMYDYPFLSPKKFYQQSNLWLASKLFCSNTQSLALSPFPSHFISPSTLQFHHNIFNNTIPYIRCDFLKHIIIEWMDLTEHCSSFKGVHAINFSKFLTYFFLNFFDFFKNFDSDY